MVNFNQNLFTEEHDFKESFESLNGEAMEEAPEAAAAEIPTSADISGVEIRLSNVVISDNKTAKIWPLPGLAKVYFLNLIVSDTSSDAISLDLKGFEKVDDGDSLSVDRTLFMWQMSESTSRPPTQVHVMTSLIKSKKDLRDIGSVMADVNNDAQYKTLVSDLAAVVKNASAVTNVSNMVFTAAAIVGKYLGKVDDKPLLTWVQSFTNINGDWDHTGKTEKKAENKYATMKLTCVVRDKDRPNANGG